MLLKPPEGAPINVLPLDFCQEVLLAYDLPDYALDLLLHRGAYSELLHLLRERLEQALKEAKVSPEKVKQRQEWVRRTVRYCRKVNERSGSEAMVMSTLSEWLFKVDIGLALECFKKSSKAKDKTPFHSERLLREIKQHGGLKACLKYLEYLCLECRLSDRLIHTELACLYVQYLNTALTQYTMPNPEEGENTRHLQMVVDVDRADTDKIILELRRKLMVFFEQSDLCEASVVLELMPEGYLLKERALMLAKAKRYREAVHICLDVLHDPDYATQVAERALAWHNQDSQSMYYLLFDKL
jgi:hypothetical protein